LGRERQAPLPPRSIPAASSHAQTAVIENGFVHIPETAPWLAEYLHEVAETLDTYLVAHPEKPEPISGYLAPAAP
jgi:hypothetical protein